MGYRMSKRSPILNRKYPKIIYLEYDPVSNQHAHLAAHLAADGVAVVAINVHTGSHHIRISHLDDWYCIDSATDFCKEIDEHITRNLDHTTGDPITLEKALEDHCENIFTRMRTMRVSIYHEEDT